MEELISLLNESFPGIDFSGPDKLIDDGLLDSFDLLQLIDQLGQHYRISIPPDALLPEHFNSVDAIYRLLSELQDTGKDI